MTTTTDQTPPFTPESLNARLNEMRDIAETVIKSYETDIDRDEEAMRANPHTRRWLWVPYENGSHLAALDPHGKRWAAAVAQHAQTAYAKTPTAYLVTAERITAITWQIAEAIIEDLPDPQYAVIDDDGLTLTNTNDWRQALTVYERDHTATTLTETTAGQTLKTKKPQVATGP